MGYAVVALLAFLAGIAVVVAMVLIGDRQEYERITEFESWKDDQHLAYAKSKKSGTK